MSKWNNEEAPRRTLPHTRYENDVQFKTLVSLLYCEIERGSYTPTELREACHLAACMYEERHVRPMLIDPSEPFKWNFKE